MKKRMLIEEWIIAVVLCIMVLMVAGQVLSRYVFHTSISHTEELVRYFFVWITFLGAAAAVYRKKHLSIAGLVGFFPLRVTKWIRVSCWFGGVIFAGVLLVFGIRIVILQIHTGQTTAALGFPMWIIGLAVPVCSIVIILRLILSALEEKAAGNQDKMKNYPEIL